MVAIVPLQKPDGLITHPGLLPVGEQQEPCKHVDNHEPDL